LKDLPRRIPATNCETLARFSPQTAKRRPGFRRKPRNQNLCDEVRLKRACGTCGLTRRLLVFPLRVSGNPSLRPRRSNRGIDVMLSNYRHWLEYDHVSLAVLLVGVGFVELIVLNI
jgi:hypothetical protein